MITGWYIDVYITPQPQFNNPNFVSITLLYIQHEKLGTQRQYIFPSNLYVHVRTHYTFMRF